MLAEGVSLETAAIRLGVKPSTLKTYIIHARKPDKYMGYSNRMNLLARRAAGHSPTADVGSADWWKARGF